jgi:hypothetical protein
MDLLTRLSLRTLGLLPAVKPLTAPRFGPYDPAALAGPNYPEPSGATLPDHVAETSASALPNNRPDAIKRRQTSRPPAAPVAPKPAPAMEPTPQSDRIKAPESRLSADHSDTGPGFPPSEELFMAAGRPGGARFAPRNSQPAFSGHAHGAIPHVPPDRWMDRAGPSGAMDVPGRIPGKTPPPPESRMSERPAVPPVGPRRILHQQDAPAPDSPDRSRQITLEPPGNSNQRLVPDHNGKAAVSQTALQDDLQSLTRIPDHAAHNLPAAPAEPVIQVSIGHIEVRAITPPAAPTPKLPPKAGVLTLDQYLQKRSN